MVENFEDYPNCKICNSNKIEKIFKCSLDNFELNNFLNLYYKKVFFNFFLIEELKNKSYTINKCSSCKFIWQQKPFSYKNNFILYEKIIDWRESLKKSLLKSKNKKFEIDRVFINFLSKEKKVILDYGAGWGHWALQTFKEKTYCYELSKKRLKYIKKKKLNFIEDINNKKFYNFFNFIQLDQVLEHLGDFKSFFEIIRKISKNKAILFIAVPEGRKIIKKKKLISFKKGPTQPFEHINCFNNCSLKKLLKKHNFEHLSFLQFSNICLNIFIKKPSLLPNILIKFYKHFFSTEVYFIKK